MTKQRLLVYQIIKNSPSHLTADEVFEIAQKRLPSIVRATVYNNLNILAKKNIIQRIKINGQPAHYDKTIKPHDHLLCDECGGIADIEINNLLDDILKKTDVKINSYELILHYVCDKCLRKNKAVERSNEQQNYLKEDL